MNFGTRLRVARTNKGWTQNELAERSGVNQATISKIERGDQEQSVHTPILASTLEVSSLWLATGVGQMSAGISDMVVGSAYASTPIPGELISGGGNTGPATALARKVYVISWVQAGHWAETAQPVPDNDDWVITANCPPHAFALRVKGDSMYNPGGHPSIPDGAVIIVDPDGQAENGSLVVAQLDGTAEATFKRLIIDAGQRYLKPLNPQYPIITIDENCAIIGVVKDAILKL